MKKRTLLFIILLLLLAVSVAALSFGFILGKRVSILPEVVHQLPDDAPNMIQWRKDWREANNDVVTATVIGSDTNKLFVYVDYLYSGNHGPEATTCGGLKVANKNVAWSSCSPTSIKRGRGFVVLRLQLNKNASDFEYSDGISFNMYDKNGGTFFNKTFKYKKLWFTNQPRLVTYLEKLLAN